MQFRARLLLLLAALSLSACMPLRYLTQATVVQARLDQDAVPIKELLDGKHVDGRTARLLAAVPGIKKFGERHGLRATNNYTSYVNLHRDQVIWVVSACKPLAFEPKQWSFPIVGSFTYLGWFDGKEAGKYGDTLRKEGWDADVRRSSAYSTLGWFEDSVLSTMIREGDEALGDLAEVILHESLHATFYVPGQSTLNESVANFTGRALATHYLEETVGKDSIEYAAYAAEELKRDMSAARMRKAYEALEKLYATPRPDAEKLAVKDTILRDLERDIGAQRTINNATLIQFATYGSGQIELGALLAAYHDDWKLFLSALESQRKHFSSAEEHTDPGELLRPLLERVRAAGKTTHY